MTKFPQDWYDFDSALERGLVTLRGSKRALILSLALSYVGSLAAFGGLCAYYYGQTTVEFMVSQVHEMPGYSCRPLQRDDQYGLLMNYDECVSTYYKAPSVDDFRIVPYSHYGPIVYAVEKTPGGYSDLKHSDGPWNFTPTANNVATRDGPFPKASPERLAYHHLPFPSISSMSYTVNDECRVPYYNGYENHPQYSDTALDDLLRYPIERAAANGEGHVGYGWYGITNINLNLPAQVGEYDYPPATDNVFKLATGTDFVDKCEGNFTQTFQSRVNVNGTFVFPQAYGADYSSWDKTPSLGDRSIKMRKGTIAMTPLYPITVHSQAEYYDYDTPGSHDTYFGAPRCEYYEKEVARQAFEYVYSKPHCHPCDSFKVNSPFLCERTMHKSVAEVIALATSNALAVFAAFIAAVPIVFALGGAKKKTSSAAPRWEAEVESPSRSPAPAEPA